MTSTVAQHSHPLNMRVRGGLDLKLEGAPAAQLGRAPTLTRVGWDGADFSQIRPKFLVAEGQRVRCGEPLMLDRRRREICFTAPASGVIRRLQTGAQRRLARLEIEFDSPPMDDESISYELKQAESQPEALRRLLLQSGLWTALRCRPYGHIPDPAGTADALFVQAIDTQPLAADAAWIIQQHEEAFARGVRALARLNKGPLFVCQGVGKALIAPQHNIRLSHWQGRHPAGMPGTHVHRLFPLGQRCVWEIHYQEVIALGHLLQHGRLWSQRWVSVAGDAARHPAIYPLPLGARLDQLLPGLARSDDVAVVSGSPLHGRQGHYLGRRHYQVSLFDSTRLNRAQPIWRRWLRLGQQAPFSALIPLDRFEAVFPFRIAPTPLLRALCVGDVETAQRLGALQLLEEDLDLLSHVCASGNRYGELLRRLLDECRATL